MKITVREDGSIWHDNWVERRSPLRSTPSESPWRASWCTDPDAKVIADRHYNRQKPESKRFMPPARSLVLLTDNQSAVWGTSYPFAEYVLHAWAGAFVNSLFRNEGEYLSSTLIRWAVAHTIWTWPEIPDLGMITFVDAGKVRPKRDPGRCYLRAGFQHVGFTKGGLYAFQLLPKDMPNPEPVVTR